MAAIFSAFATWLWSALGSSIILTAIAIMFKDVIFGFVSDVLGMAVGAINEVGFTLPTLASAVDALPMEVLVVMKRIGVDDCLALIVTALTLRASMKLFGWVKAWKPRL